MSFLKFDVESFLKQGVVFSLSPTELLVGWGAAEWSATPFEGTKAFYLPNFELTTEEPWLHLQFTAIVSPEEFIDSMGFVELPPIVQWQLASPLFFKEQFLYLKELIHQGELKKGVPITFEKGECKTNDSFRRYLLSQLASQEAPVKIYGYWNEEEGILGLTPEILFELKAKYQVRSMAIAGTRSRDDKKRLPLLSDNKELHEHYLVIDDIVQVLEPWGMVKTHPTEVLRLPYLEHLKTDIEVKLRQPKEYDEIVRSLHPTPALGVSPREVLRKYIGKLHGEDRGRFGAPIGYRNEDGTGVCLVAIRNVQWRGDQILIGSGCGIVRDSEFDREWEEQKLKRESVKKTLGL